MYSGQVSEEMKPKRDRSAEYRNRKRTAAYHSWNAMTQRCYNHKHHAFKNYGGRGIRVCERWRGNFAQFLADMGEPPTGMTLDRIDPDLNYCLENCRWATVKEQNNNQRRHKQKEITQEDIDSIDDLGLPIQRENNC